MAITAHYYTKFKENKFYHVYNRSVDKKTLFSSAGNYRFFLMKFDFYLSPMLDTYAFCLLGNHFHFLVQVKDLSVFRTENNIPASRNTHDLVCMQWRKLFQSYAMAFNKQHNRTGTLFQTPFKRALIDEPAYLNRVVEYISTQTLSGTG